MVTSQKKWKILNGTKKKEENNQLIFQVSRQGALIQNKRYQRKHSDKSWIIQLPFEYDWILGSDHTD
jgi:hypothetical protein